MEVNKIYQGHSLEVLKTFPDQSIDMCITSPPYWGLRDYKVESVILDGDKNCDHTWGNLIEKTMTGGKKSAETSTHESGVGHIKNNSVFCLKCGAWLGNLGLEPTFDLYIKHLCDIFDEVKRILKSAGTCWVNMGDTYGGTGDKGDYRDPKYINGRNGQGNSITSGFMQKCLLQIPSRFSIEMINRGWILRNEIIWQKPNCMPSSASDRFTVDFEKLFFFVKNKKYYFEQQLEIAKTEDNVIKIPSGWDVNKGAHGSIHREGRSKCTQYTYVSNNKKNKRTTWSISTGGFPEAHFAVFPEELIETPIKAGCPEAGIILDPFIGSGTTGIVAKKLYRNYIGIELNPDYAKMAEDRIKDTLVNKRLFEEDK